MIIDLWRVLIYIHHNTVHHEFCRDFRNYRHSSYQAMLSDLDTRLKQTEVLSWFDGRAGFIESHLTKLDLESIKDYVIE